MKKTIIICSTVVAVLLTVALLGTSVFAAINNSFGANNVIRFVGKGERMQFTLTGTVTGTDDDNDEKLQKVWEYDFDDKEKSKDAEWVIDKVLLFQRHEDRSMIAITYNFEITNTGNVGIRTFITGNRVTDRDFEISVVGTPDDIVYINVGETRSVSLTIKPQISLDVADRSVDCNFNVNFMPFE